MNAQNWDFPATRWNLVVDCHQSKDLNGAAKALADLCTDYWHPLYAFARRIGKTPEDAKDATQGFFGYAIEKELFSRADPEVGKLRTFLLTAFKRYMLQQRDREQAQKRGGGVSLLSLNWTDDDGDPVDIIGLEDNDTPERAFERNWAASVIRVTQESLRKIEEAEGRGHEFAVLKPFVAAGGGGESDFELVAADLGIEEASARKKVSRLRQRFRDVLRKEIADTLSVRDDALVDEELRVLIEALRDGGL